MIVVKIGGGVGTGFDNLVRDMEGRKDVILVHGGSDFLNKLSEDLGIPPRFVTSPSGHTSRVTDEATLDLIRMAYAGSVNKRLVERLRKEGVNALGLSGIDGGLLRGRRKGSIRIVENGKVRILHGDHTGAVEEVNSDLLRLLLDNGFLPVITIPIEATDGGSLNADADRAAAAVASAIGADTLLLLTNKPGLLKDVQDDGSLVRSVSKAGIDQAMDIAEGRMKKKVLAAKEALDGGVRRVVIGNANSEGPIEKALAGEGTVIC